MSSATSRAVTQQAAIAAEKLDNTPTGLRSDFKKTVDHLLPVDPVQKTQKKCPNTEISGNMRNYLLVVKGSLNQSGNRYAVMLWLSLSKVIIEMDPWRFFINNESSLAHYKWGNQIHFHRLILEQIFHYQEKRLTWIGVVICYCSIDNRDLLQVIAHRTHYWMRGHLRIHQMLAHNIHVSMGI